MKRIPFDVGRWIYVMLPMGFFISSFLLVKPALFSQSLEEGFSSEIVLSGLQDPASFAFAPDGRLFYGERITGNLKVAQWEPASNHYISTIDTFYHFDVPQTRHRSSGLRGFTFDPEFETNGFIYAFYMKDNPRHNRVVRIQADPGDSTRALSGETLIMDLPFNASSSSGSHNGGDLVFGADGKLYFTTGDGWNGGDDVQSLNTYTGKVMRINKDGSLPTDNPFYNMTSGAYRAIYALGLRNPYSVSNLSSTQQIYINDAVGSQKATVFKLLPGANYGHDGYDGIGTSTPVWANLSVDGASVITGGLWYPSNGYWPVAYQGNYFAAFWGSNSNGAPGAITRLVSETDLAKSMFYSNMLVGGELKPVMLKLGPDDNIYYMMTDYETGAGEVHKISYNVVPSIPTPYFTLPPGQYDDPIQLGLAHDSINAKLYFTLDGTVPDSNAALYTGPVNLDTTTLIQAVAYVGTESSQVISGNFIIGPIPNLPPVADAGPNLIGEVNTEITLNGSDTYDPDGSALELQEYWEQVAGPPVTLFDADETIANFTPTQIGLYAFKIMVEDIYGLMDSSVAIITVLPEIDDYLSNLIARWSFEEGQGDVAEDTSPNAHTGTVVNTQWVPEVSDSSQYSMRFSNSGDLVDIGPLDISNNAMSICFWTKLNSFDQSDARFISKASGQFDQDHYWMISTLDGSKLRFRLNTNGTTSTLTTGTNTLFLDEWTFITATYDGAHMRLYKNGVMLDSLAKSGNLSTSPIVEAAIGNQPSSATGGSRSLDGWMDEVRIYSTALTKDQIHQIYEARFSELCLVQLVINELIPMLNRYEARSSIMSSAAITGADSTIFTAGESITLDPDFEVSLGATFVAKITGCIGAAPN